MGMHSCGGRTKTIEFPEADLPFLRGNKKRKYHLFVKSYFQQKITIMICALEKRTKTNKKLYKKDFRNGTEKMLEMAPQRLQIWGRRLASYFVGT